MKVLQYLILIACLGSLSSACPVVYVSPNYSTGAVGDTVRVTIEITEVYNFWGIEFFLWYNANILHTDMNMISEVNTWLPLHLTNQQGIYWWPSLVNEDNPDSAYVTLAFSRPMTFPGLTGRGTLINIDFQVVGTGFVDLRLTGVNISDPVGNAIPHDTLNGVFDNTGARLSGWGSNIQINDDNGSADQSFPKITKDPSGNYYAVWQDNRNGNWDIYFSYKPAGGDWGTNAKVNDDAGKSWQMRPDIAVDASGNAYCVWQDEREGNWNTYFSYRPAGGDWGTNVKVNALSARPQVHPAIAVSSEGNAYAIWADFRMGSMTGNWDIYSDYRPAGGSWGSDVRVDDISIITHWAEDPDITIDIDGGAHAVWKYTNGNENTWAGTIRYAYRASPAASWQAIPVTPAGDSVNYYPSISVDSSKNLYCVWQCGEGDFDIMFSYRAKNATGWDDWTAPVQVDDAVNPSYQTSASVSADTDGNAYTVWADTRNGHWDIYSSYRPSSGTWEANQKVNDDPGTAWQWYPSIVAGSAQTVWQDFRDNNWNIYYSVEEFDIIPPVSPCVTKGEKISNSDVKFYWNDVTTDTLGNPETIDRYVIYRSIDPAFIPSPSDSIAGTMDTFFVDLGILSSSQDYYYLIKAVDIANNRSRKSNMGYLFHKTVNENPSATDKNWVSLPYHSGYTTVSDLATDFSPSGNPLEKITNLRDDQNCESWLWDPDFFEWGGANFAIQSGRGYEMVTIKDTTLVLVGSNNPDGLITLNENPSATDKNWVSIPYNAVYATVSDITTEYSPSGNPLEKITNLRDDQNCESWLWDPDFFEWGGANFAIERGRAYEFVTIVDTFWNPTEHTNEAKQMNRGLPPIYISSLSHIECSTRDGSSMLRDGRDRWVGKLDLEIQPGKATESCRGPVWFTTLPNFSTSSYQEAGMSHIVRCHLSVKGFEGLIFTAYRPCKPFDALTQDMIGSCIMKKGDRAAIWFDVANFKNPWQDKEEMILIIEATKHGNGYFAVVNFLLDNSVDIQELSDVSLTPICWDRVHNKNVIGYSLYRGDKRLNEKVITKNEYLIEGDVILKPVLRGGYETVYGSGIQGEESTGRSTPDALHLQVYPTVFTSSTVISYSSLVIDDQLPMTNDLQCSSLRIYDATGRVVKTFGDILCNLNNSVQSVSWDGTDDLGRKVCSGVYFIRMNTKGYKSQQKVIFIR